MGVSDDGLTGTSGPNNATMSSTNQPPSRSESKREKERCHKNEDESRSVPGSPKIENRRVSNQRRQFHSHHSGSSSECQTRKSNENLNKEGTEDEHERLVRSNSMALGGGSVNSSSHGRRSSGNQTGNGANHQECSSGNVTSSSVASGSAPANSNANLSNVYASTTNVGMTQIVAEESDSDLAQNQPSTSNSRSRQKKFLKTFKHLPQEELVLQRYSCALVSDILLQGHLYITQNYFAFYSNVFGYVTKLQIPIRSVTKLSKEKTAKIIPNAVGLCTEEGKHIFASLLSRDTTFKLMNKLWARAMRELPPDLMLRTVVVTQEHPLETEIDFEEEFIHDDDDLSSDSDVAIVTLDQATDAIDSSYLVKRVSQTSGTLFYQSTSRASNKSSQTRKNNTPGLFPGESTDFLRRRSSSLSSPSATPTSGQGGILGYFTRSTILSLLVIVLLLFLLGSSLYLVFRVDALEKQVESRYGGGGMGKRALDIESLLSEPSTQQMQQALDSNVDQITTVRKSLEKLSDMVSSNKKDGGP